MSDSISNNIPDEIYLFYHRGCKLGHFVISQARKCAGNYLHMYEATKVTYTRKIDRN